MTEARYQQGTLMRVKNKTMPDTWFFRYYGENQDGKRVHRNLKIGSVREFPLRRDAEAAVLSLRAKINSEVRTPETVRDLVTHYSKHELTAERKAFATIEAHASYLKLHIVPQWGSYKLSAVRTIAVEEWLNSLPLAPGTRTKIRNIMSAVFTHGIRYEWITFNPISKVRCSSVRLREPDILTPDEFRSLLQHLTLRERAMVMLVGSTGLRRSEMFALKWSNVNMLTMEVTPTGNVVRNRFGKLKTVASRKPLPIHHSVYLILSEWRHESPYPGDEDFVFPSVRKNGTKPSSPDTLLKKIIRPALIRAGITGKVVGWHTFRHSLATNLRSMGVDVKVAQELLRHANSRITLDFYTQAVSADKRLASGRQIEMLMGDSNVSEKVCVPLRTVDFQGVTVGPP
jgi:integrase